MMIRELVLAAAISTLLGAPMEAYAAERVAAEVACEATKRSLVYDCMITLTGREDGRPIDGAKVVVRADMPSMPMAHNVAPVSAEATGTPGMYFARIELAMHGEWALTIDVSGPTRDRIVRAMAFGATQREPGKTYEGVGRVVEVDRRKRRVTIDHDDIAGYMKAMVMSFEVARPALLQGLRKGRRIRFRIDAAEGTIVDLAPFRD